jgi:putative ABC transport system permease protein
VTLESIRAALWDVLANKVRSGLTILGILIGTAAVILLVAVGVGVSNELQRQIRNLGTNAIYVFPETKEAAGHGGTETRPARLTRMDLKALSDRHRAPTVTLAAPAVETAGTVTWDGTSYSLKTFQGVEPAYNSIRNVTVKAGRLLTGDDELNHARVALIGSTVVQHLMGRGANPVGQDVRFNGVRLRIVGVLSPRGSDGVDDEDDVMVAPLATTVAEIVGTVESYSHLVVQAVSPAVLSETMGEITAVLRQAHQLEPGAPADFNLINADELAKTSESEAAALELFLAAIAAVSLIVGGIGVMNIMLVTVTERTQEIGIRKALGAHNSDVITQFLAEAMLLAGIGGLVGVMAGVALGQIPLGVSKPVVLPAAVIVSFGVSVLVGVVFGVYPARRAAALTPIDALRFE